LKLSYCTAGDFVDVRERVWIIAVRFVRRQNGNFILEIGACSSLSGIETLVGQDKLRVVSNRKYISILISNIRKLINKKLSILCIEY
jgi:hypothetical protein